MSLTSEEERKDVDEQLAGLKDLKERPGTFILNPGKAINGLNV